MIEHFTGVFYSIQALSTVNHSLIVCTYLASLSEPHWRVQSDIYIVYVSIAC